MQMRGNWGIKLLQLGFILMAIDYITHTTHLNLFAPIPNWSSFKYLTQK